MIYLATKPPPPGIVYFLGRGIYCSLTNEPIGLPLLTSRGRGFSLGKDSQFSKLQDGFKPSAEDILSAVQPCIDNPLDFDPRVTFAGYGDPLAEFETLCKTAELITTSNPDTRLSIGVNTNGIILNDVGAEETTKRLKASNISRVSVALNYDRAKDYRDMMWPPASVPDAFGSVCNFIQTLTNEGGIEVSVSVVNNNIANVDGVKKLAASLGCDNVRVRSFFA